MKMILTVSLMFLVFVIFSGCRLYSMIVLENPEFPDAMLPTEMDADLLKKYTVGGVIVHPRIHYADSAQTTYKLLAVFFSKTNTPVVSIKTLTVSVSGTKLEYGKQIISELISDWELYPANKPFYVCSISGEPINRPKEEMVKARVNVSLEVLVEEKSGKVTKKKIDVCFLPKKRSYLE